MTPAHAAHLLVMETSEASPLTRSIGSPEADWTQLSPASPAAESPKPSYTPASPTGSTFLPPCKICGEKASGFHYGLNTCEACKGFFRRSLSHRGGYKCVGNNDCEISPGKRSCSYCRHYKCISLGMSKNAIKIGRYTLEKKNRDIEEAKKIKLDTSPPGSRLVDSPCSPSLSETSDDTLVCQLAEACQRNHPYGELFDNLDSLAEQQLKYYDDCMLRSSLFGELKPLSKDEYSAFYKATGMDLDDRQICLENLTHMMAQGAIRLIKFAKSIPGFKDLPIDDQASLVKAARFEYWMLSSYPGMNKALQVATLPSGKFYRMVDVYSVCDVEFARNMFDYAEKLKKVNLSTKELALLKAVCVTFSDRVELISQSRVEEIQLSLLNKLVEQLNESCEKPNQKFFQLWNHVITLRDLSDANFKMTENMSIDSPEIKKYPLLYEILSMW